MHLINKKNTASSEPHVFIVKKITKINELMAEQYNRTLSDKETLYY